MKLVLDDNLWNALDCSEAVRNLIKEMVDMITISNEIIENNKENCKNCAFKHKSSENLTETPDFSVIKLKKKANKEQEANTEQVLSEPILETLTRETEDVESLQRANRTLLELATYYKRKYLELKRKIEHD